MDLSPDQRRRLLDAARETIRGALRPVSPPVSPTEPPAGPSAPSAPGPTSTPAPPSAPMPDEPTLRAPAGCFVSLHELGTHRLRGCVGRLEAVDPLWHAVRRAALGVLDDPRFRDDPVRLSDLPNLQVEISVLSPMRPVASPLDFDPQQHGVYLTHAGRSGCFLPQVARETGWTREQLLARLCTEKLGLASTAWRDPAARLLVFATLLIGPEPFETRSQ